MSVETLHERRDYRQPAYLSGEHQTNNLAPGPGTGHCQPQDAADISKRPATGGTACRTRCGRRAAWAPRRTRNSLPSGVSNSFIPTIWATTVGTPSKHSARRASRTSDTRASSKASAAACLMMSVAYPDMNVPRCHGRPCPDNHDRLSEWYGGLIQRLRHRRTLHPPCR